MENVIIVSSSDSGKGIGKENSLTFLDSLRGFAAVYVMIGHSRWLLWEGYNPGYLSHISQYTILGKFFVYFLSIFRFGHEAVLFFFVLSGFVIHLKYSKALQKNSDYKLDFKVYFFKRLRRIYPPFLLALFFTLLLDSLGKSLGYQIYFGSTNILVLTQNVKSDISLNTFIGNLLFLQDSIVPVFGSNGPLWSLKFEWWFYMIYPLLFFIARKKPLSAFLLIILIAFGISFTFLGLVPMSEVLVYLPCWWLGCFGADIYTSRINLNKNILIVLPVFLLTMIVLYFFKKPLFVNFAWSSFFFLIIVVLASISRKKKLIYLNKFYFLGSFSYTLYVVHFPILVLLSGFIYSRIKSLPMNFGYFIFGVIGCIIISWGFYFIIEKPFMNSQRNEIN